LLKKQALNCLRYMAVFDDECSPSTMTDKNQRQYDESAIRILEGLEPVKLRPGQFTRTDCPLHIVQEVLDNAVDEAIAGFASRIEIALLPDGFVRISDNGRGIPVGQHPVKKIPVVQAIFTVLYSGGKFDKASGGAYSFAGGLHGVGVSVTNALSEKLTADVVRDGWRYRIGFADGDVVEPLKKVEPAEGSGTTVTVKPNPKYFDSAEVPAKELKALLRSKAVLLKGLEAVFTDERGEQPVTEVYRYDAGMSAFLAEQAGEEPIVPVIVGEAYCGPDSEAFSEGEGAAWAFSWYERGDATGASFVNLIPTPQGGTHVGGLRQAIFGAVRAHIEHHSLMPKGVKLAAEDVFKNVRYCLSGRLLDPSFDNQTKDRLNTRDAVKLLETVAGPQIQAWFNLNPAHAKTIADIAIANATARSRAASKVERRKSSSVVMLPGKLADCESSDASRTELFLVEGDSAGGSAKMGRSKEYQAILPLRGKVLNTWDESRERAMSNREIQDISTALGVAPHGLTEEVDWSKLRYNKVCILADADVDGSHIQTLLLTLFFKHFPQLLLRGHIYVARPPLYRLDVEAVGKKKSAKKIYAMDETELAGWEERVKKEGYAKWKVGRFKGLGEMDPPELWDTTLNPETRRLSKVVLPEPVRAEATTAFDNLMNKNKAGWRRTWMERRGHEVGAE
jgi:topoisomerase-4 subunit B